MEYNPKISIELLKSDESLREDEKFYGSTEWTSEIDFGCDEFYPDFKP
jgi:nitroimidazol reductase NimA-like FMN-containing flavoprotein (pyridoxamine 5'-phosphate oxidase superfamily)